jgi:hypothetical protein
LVLIGGPILVATGLTLAIRYWSLTDGWIATAIVLVIAQGIVGSLVDRRLHELRESFEVRAREVPGVTVRNLGKDRLIQAGHGRDVARASRPAPELARLLRPGGRIALVSQPRRPGATAATSMAVADELAELLTEAGVEHLRIEMLDLDPPAACALGRVAQANASEQ